MKARVEAPVAGAVDNMKAIRDDFKCYKLCSHREEASNLSGQHELG